MRELCIKYDDMLIFGIINAFKCIDNHVIDVKNSILAVDLVFLLPCPKLELELSEFF